MKQRTSQLFPPQQPTNKLKCPSSYSPPPAPPLPLPSGLRIFIFLLEPSERCENSLTLFPDAAARPLPRQPAVLSFFQRPQLFPAALQRLIKGLFFSLHVICSEGLRCLAAASLLILVLRGQQGKKSISSLDETTHRTSQTSLGDQVNTGGRLAGVATSSHSRLTLDDKHGIIGVIKTSSG